MNISPYLRPRSGDDSRALQCDDSSTPIDPALQADAPATQKRFSPASAPPADDDVEQRRARAADEFEQQYPDSDWQVIPTSGQDLRCGLFAIQRMLRDVEGIPAPTIATLVEIAEQVTMVNIQNVFGGRDHVDDAVLDGLINNNMFGADQLDQILQQYGQRHGVDLRLGWIRSNETVDMAIRDQGNPGEQMVWIHYDPEGVGHWSAIARARHQITSDDSIARFDDTRYMLNLGKVGLLVRCPL
jgi:hypothetical protein